MAKATEVPTCDDGYDDEHDNESESESDNDDEPTKNELFVFINMTLLTEERLYQQ
jgi:hypothetical protein